MIETSYPFTQTNEKAVERIVDDEYAQINHITLGKDTSLPEHRANSNVYLLIVRGTMSLQLEEQENQDYGAGTIVNIPFDTKMGISNRQEAVLEFFVVKAPNPRSMQP